MPKVSVIIPCYNLGQYLNEAVDSVLAQTFQDFEIIIVNDGSTDEFTNKLLAGYNRPKTKVLTTDNQGLPSARNNGIKISNGEYLCCLDADDKYHPYFLEKVFQVLNEDRAHSIGIVTTWVQLFDGENTIWKTSPFNPYKLAIENIIHVASLFRKECWEKTGGYLTNLSGYQDWNFWISIVALGYSWHCIKEPLFFYRVRNGSMIKASDKKRLILFRQIVRNNQKFYLNNFEKIIIQSAVLLKSQYMLNKKTLDAYLELQQKHRILEQDFDLSKQEILELQQKHRILEQDFDLSKQEILELQQKHRILEQDFDLSKQELLQKEEHLKFILNTHIWKLRQKIYEWIEIFLPIGYRRWMCMVRLHKLVSSVKKKFSNIHQKK